MKGSDKPMTERCWKAYQLGQGSADHTDKEVFIEVVGQLESKINHLKYLLEISDSHLSAAEQALGEQDD